MIDSKEQKGYEVPKETSDFFNSVQEPVAEYITSAPCQIKLSDEEIEELWEIDRYCDEHPEEMIPFDAAMAELNT